jgi:hypothetical protein
MRHGYMYGGAFESNHGSLRPGATSFRAHDGQEHELAPWPADVDGLRVIYMEKAGKKFFAVRLLYENYDLVLECPVPIDPLRHMGGRRFSATPTIVDDDQASALLDDIIRENPGEQPELALMINRVNQTRRASRRRRGSSASD